jgi:FkbM family methyltransferase
MKWQKALAEKLLFFLTMTIYLIRIPRLHVLLPTLVEKLQSVFKDSPGGIFVTSPFGFKFHIDDNFSLQTLLTSCERATLRLLFVLSKHTNTFINVGANFGYYALAIKRTNLNKNVIAFEPQNHNFIKLKSNALENDLSIEINQVAVADFSQKERKLFKYRDGNPGMFTLSPIEEREYIFDSLVETISLDEYFKQEIPKSLILMDIEGGEVLALKGATRLLKSRSLFICEVNSLMLQAYSSSSKELFELFKEVDYLIYWIDERGVLAVQPHDCPPIHEVILGRENGANYLFLPVEDCEILEKNLKESLGFSFGIKTLLELSTFHLPRLSKRS